MKKRFLFLIFFLATPVCGSEQTWQSLQEGLELAQFAGQGNALVVLRISPAVWQLTLLARAELGRPDNLSVKQWAQTHHLTAAINAGMFERDHIRHVGFMKNEATVLTDTVYHYKSVAAFAPKQSHTALFRLFDLADKSAMTELSKQYGVLIQNLRLIKKPRINVWPQQGKKWSEAALGEDRQGRVLFLFSRHPYTMHDFNALLLKLPIDIVAAQHLEGGPEAQLYVKTDAFERGWTGSYETGFLENNSNEEEWPVPNVMGIRPRR